MKFEKKTVYIYEINGQEKIKITNAAEARKWDDIFDVAQMLDKVLLKHDPGIKLSDTDRSDLCIYLARNRNEFVKAMQAKPDIVEVPSPGPTIPSSKDGFSL